MVARMGRVNSESSAYKNGRSTSGSDEIKQTNIRFYECLDLLGNNEVFRGHKFVCFLVFIGFVLRI